MFYGIGSHHCGAHKSEICRASQPTRKPGSLQDKFLLVWETLVFPFGEGSGNPLQCSCLENPLDGGAWWAVAYGVAQSRT